MGFRVYRKFTGYILGLASRSNTKPKLGAFSIRYEGKGEEQVSKPGNVRRGEVEGARKRELIGGEGQGDRGRVTGCQKRTKVYRDK